MHVYTAFSIAYSFSCATATGQDAHLGTSAQSSQVEEAMGGANRMNADSAQLFVYQLTKSR